MQTIARDLFSLSGLYLAERLRLLSLMWMIWPAIHLEFLEHGPPQFVFRQHPLNGEFDDAFRFLR